MKKYIMPIFLMVALCATIVSCKAEYKAGKTVHLRGTYQNKSIELKAELPEGAPIFNFMGDPKYRFRNEIRLPGGINGNGAYIDMIMYSEGAEISVIVLDLEQENTFGTAVLPADLSEEQLLTLFLLTLKERFVPDTDETFADFNEYIKVHEHAMEYQKFAGRNYVSQSLEIVRYYKSTDSEDEWTYHYTVKVRRIDNIMVILCGYGVVNTFGEPDFAYKRNMDEMWGFFKKA